MVADRSVRIITADERVVDFAGLGDAVDRLKAAQEKLIDRRFLLPVGTETILMGAVGASS